MGIMVAAAGVFSVIGVVADAAAGVVAVLEATEVVVAVTIPPDLVCFLAVVFLFNLPPGVMTVLENINSKSVLLSKVSGNEPYLRLIGF